MKEIKSSAELVGAIFEGILTPSTFKDRAVALVDEHFRGIRETAKALKEALKAYPFQASGETNADFLLRRHSWEQVIRTSALQRAQEEGLGE